MARERDVLVVNCGQLLTLRGPVRARGGREQSELGMVRHGALLIRSGIIKSVGTQARVTRSVEARRAECLDAHGRVVMPGFVDSHTHALFAAPRLEEYVLRLQGASYEDIARAGGGIQTSARKMRLAGDAFLGKHLISVIDRCVEHGTTTVEVKSGYGLEVAQEYKMLRIIHAAAHRAGIDLIPTLLIHDVPERLQDRRSQFLKQVVEQLIPTVARKRWAAFCDVFCDRGYFSIAEAKTILQAATRAGLKLKLHAEQLAHTGAARMAASLEAVSIDHLDQIRVADMPHLRKAGTVATLLPGSNFHLGTATYPPARALIDAGIPVALATNFNPGSSPTLNMQMILSLACSYMRMTPAEAICAATINGAYALNVGSRVGSLEPGKQADLAIMEAADYREIPYYFGLNHCRMVMKKGRMVWSKEAGGRIRSAGRVRTEPFQGG